MKGQREGRYPSGTRETSNTAAAAVHVILELISQAFTAPFLISVTNRFAEEYIDYLPSQPDSCSI